MMCTKFESQSLPIGWLQFSCHLHRLLPEKTSNCRTTAERKISVGAATDRANLALDASSLHSNRTALRKRVLGTVLVTRTLRPSSYQKKPDERSLMGLHLYELTSQLFLISSEEIFNTNFLKFLLSLWLQIYKHSDYFIIIKKKNN